MKPTITTVTKRHAGDVLHLYRVATTFLGDDEPRFWEIVSRHSQEEDDNLFIEGNRTPSAVAIVAFTPKKELVAIREYRYGLGAWILSLPAGLVDPGMTIKQTAVRELRQETGMRLTTVRHIRTNCFSSPGLSDEMLAFVFGTAEGTPTNENVEPGERIEPILLDLNGMREIRDNGTLISARLAVIIEMLCWLSPLGENDVTSQ